MIGDEAYWLHLVTRLLEIAGTALNVVGAFGSLAFSLLTLPPNRARRDAHRELSVEPRPFDPARARVPRGGRHQSTPSPWSRPYRACPCSPKSSLYARS